MKRLLADAELDKAILREAASGRLLGGAAQLLSPAKRRQAVEHVRDTLGRDAVTERRARRVLGQARNTQRRRASVADDEPQLVKRIVWMARSTGGTATAGLRPSFEPKAGG